tara:strand:+ start:237 stop:596 length:360 start_codon:yes stop_codon:yes gene_type:complete
MQRHYVTPLDDGYTCKGFALILAHALYLFHKAQLTSYLDAVACIAIATKLHDDFSPENSQNVYQQHLNTEEKKQFGRVESRVFLKDLQGRVVFPVKDIVKHWQRCACLCNAPIVPVRSM